MTVTKTMRRLFSRAAVLLAVMLTATTAQAQSFGGGSGTEEDPYIISTTGHMDKLASDVNGGNEYYGKYFRLDADLDYDDKTYTPIGRYVGTQSSTGYYAFSGVFDGNSYTIRNVIINKSSTTGVALFGVASVYGIIKNLTLASSSIRGNNGVGGIVGHLMGGTTSTDRGILNCTVAADVTISGDNNVGGIAGWTGGDIRDCLCLGSVSASANSYVGGIAGGAANDSEITGCYVGGNCTLGAVGEKNSATGTDEGAEAWHLCTISFDSGFSSAEMRSDADVTVGSVSYYKSGTTVRVYLSAETNAPTGYYGTSFMVGDEELDPVTSETDVYTFTVPTTTEALITIAGLKRDIAYTDWVHVSIAAQTYSGEALTPIATVTDTKSGTAVTLVEGTHYRLVMPDGTMTDASDYTIKVKGIGDFGNSTTATFTIERLPANATVVTAPTAIEGLEYNVNPQTLVTAGVAEGGIVLYSLDGESYSEDLPTATRPGTYTVYYKAHSDDNHLDGEAQTLTVTIGALDFPWTGEGTATDPYRITTIEEMTALATNIALLDYSDVYFRLEADLDYTGQTYAVVGNNDYHFNGIFDGYSHTINNVNIGADDQMYQGLFGVIGSAGVVRNLTLGADCTVRGRARTGAIAGWNYGLTTDCRNYATVRGISRTMEFMEYTYTVDAEYIGGIVGYNAGAVENCVNYGTVIGLSRVGGIAGLHHGTAVASCINYGSVTKSNDESNVFGGIIGYNSGYGVTDCINEGTVTADSDAGGIVGRFYNGAVSHCLNLAEVVCASDYGGVIGNNNSTDGISNNYYAGDCTLSGGARGSDIFGKAMRGYIIDTEENVFAQMMGSPEDTFTGITYDGIRYLGAGETTYLLISRGEGFSDYTLQVSAGTLEQVEDEYYGDEYYSLTMPTEGQDVTISLAMPPTLVLLEDDSQNAYDNARRIADNEGFTGKVQLSGRTLQTGGWNTFCVPFNLDTPTGWTVKQLESSSFADGTLTLNFATAESIVAGKPYLVKVTDVVENPTFDGVTVSSTATSTETTAVDFVPTLGVTEITGDANNILFIGSGNKLLHPESLPANMKGFRAYFLLKGEAALAKAFSMDFGEETTVISLTPDPSLKGEESEYYDIQGRRINGKPTQKGVYIVNGKKVIIK